MNQAFGSTRQDRQPSLASGPAAPPRHPRHGLGFSRCTWSPYARLVILTACSTFPRKLGKVFNHSGTGRALSREVTAARSEMSGLQSRLFPERHFTFRLPLRMIIIAIVPVRRTLHTMEFCSWAFPRQ